METTRFNIIKGLTSTVMCLILSLYSIDLWAASIEQLPLPTSTIETGVDRNGHSRDKSDFNLAEDCGAFEHVGYKVDFTIDSSVDDGQINVKIKREAVNNEFAYDVKLSLISDAFYEKVNGKLIEPSGIVPFKANALNANYSFFGYPEWESASASIIRVALPSGLFFEPNVCEKSYNVNLPKQVKLSFGVNKSTAKEGDINYFWVKSNLPLSPKVATPSTPFIIEATLSQAIDGVDKLSLMMPEKTTDSVVFRDLVAPRKLGRQFNDGGSLIAISSLKIPTNAVVATELPAYSLLDEMKLATITVKTPTPIVTPGQEVEFYADLSGSVTINNGTEPLVVGLEYSKAHLTGLTEVTIRPGESKSNTIKLYVIGTNREAINVGAVVNDPYIGLARAPDCRVEIESKTNLMLELDWGTRFQRHANFTSPEFPEFTVRVIDVNKQDVAYNLDAEATVTVQVGSRNLTLKIPKGQNKVTFCDENIDLIENPSQFSYTITRVEGGSSLRHATPKFDKTQAITCNVYRSSRVIYVNPKVTGGNGETWATGYNTITTALKNSSKRSQILVYVASGSYDETPIVSDGVTLLGGYDPVTDLKNGESIIKKGILIQAENSLFPAKVDGFVFENTSVSSPIYVNNNATLFNTIIRNNKVTDSLLIVQAGGLVDAVTLINNQSISSGLGLVVLNNGTIENSKILGNRVESGKGIIHLTQSEINNSVIANNTIEKGNGGTLYLTEQSRLLANTIVRNKAYVGGALMTDNKLGVMIVSNNVIWGNQTLELTHSQIVYQNGVEFYGNAIQDLSIANNTFLDAANENKLASPCFSNPSLTAGYIEKADAYNWNIRYSSRMVSAGVENSMFELPHFDIDGLSRILPNTVGAYELSEKTSIKLEISKALSKLDITISAKDSVMRDDIIVDLNYNRSENSFVNPPKSLTLKANNQSVTATIAYNIAYNGERAIIVSGTPRTLYKQIDLTQCELTSTINLTGKPVVVQLHTVAKIGTPNKTRLSEGEQFELYATVDSSVVFDEPINVWVDFGVNGTHFYQNGIQIVNSKVNLRLLPGSTSSRESTPTVLQIRNVTAEKTVTMKIIANEFIQENIIMDKNLTIIPRIYYVSIKTDRLSYLNGGNVNLEAFLENDAINQTAGSIKLKVLLFGPNATTGHDLEIVNGAKSGSLLLTSIQKGTYDLEYSPGTLTLPAGFTGEISKAKSNFEVIEKPVLVLVPPASVTEGEDINLEVKLVSDKETMTPYINTFGDFEFNVQSTSPHVKNKATSFTFPADQSSRVIKLGKANAYLGFQSDIKFDAKITNAPSDILSGDKIEKEISNTSQSLAEIEMTAISSKFVPGEKTKLKCTLSNVKADDFPVDEFLKLPIKADNPSLWEPMPDFKITSTKILSYEIEVVPSFIFKAKPTSDHIHFVNLDKSLTNVGTSSLLVSIDAAPKAPILLTVQDSVIEGKAFDLIAKMDKRVLGDNRAIIVNVDVIQGGHALEGERPYPITLNSDGEGVIRLTSKKDPANISRRVVRFEMVESDEYTGITPATIGILPENTPTVAISMTSNNQDSTWSDRYLREGKTTTLTVSLDTIIAKPLTLYVKIENPDLFESIVDTKIEIAAFTNSAKLPITAITKAQIQGLRETNITCEYFEESTGIPLILPLPFMCGIVDNPLPTVTLVPTSNKKSFAENESFDVNATLGETNNTGASLLLAMKTSDSSVYENIQNNLFTFVNNEKVAQTHLTLKNRPQTYEGVRDASFSVQTEDSPFGAVTTIHATVYDVGIQVLASIPDQWTSGKDLPIEVLMLSSTTNERIVNESHRDIEFSFKRIQGGDVHLFTVKIPHGASSASGFVSLIPIPHDADRTNVEIECIITSDMQAIRPPVKMTTSIGPASYITSLKTLQTEVRIAETATITATIPVVNPLDIPLVIKIKPADQNAWDKPFYEIVIPKNAKEGSVVVSPIKIPSQLTIDSTFMVVQTNSISPDIVNGGLNIKVIESINKVSFTMNVISATLPKDGSDISVELFLKREGSLSTALKIPVAIVQNYSTLNASLERLVIEFGANEKEAKVTLNVRNDKLLSPVRQIGIGILNNNNGDYIIGDNPVANVCISTDVEEVRDLTIGFTAISQQVPASSSASMLIKAPYASQIQLSVSGSKIKPEKNFELYFADGRAVSYDKNRYLINRELQGTDTFFKPVELFAILSDKAIDAGKKELKVNLKITKATGLFGEKLKPTSPLNVHAITFINDKPTANNDIYALTHLSDTERFLSINLLKNDIPYDAGEFKIKQLIIEGFSLSEDGPFTTTLVDSYLTIRKSNNSYDAICDYKTVTNNDIENGFQSIFYYRVIQVGASSSVARAEIITGKPFANQAMLPLKNTFIKAPAVYGEYYDVIKDPNLKKLRKLNFSLEKNRYPANEISVKLKKFPVIYNKTILNKEYKKGIWLVDALLNPIIALQQNAVGIPISVNLKGGTGGEIYVAKTILSLPPTVDSYSSDVLIDASKNKIVKVIGSSFSEKPKSYLLYQIPGKVGLSKMTLSIAKNYKDSSRTNVILPVSDPTNNSFIYLKCPKKLPKNHTKRFDLVIDNGVGLGTYVEFPISELVEFSK